MTKLSKTPLTSTSRFLIAGAVFLFALLIAAAAFTNGAGLEMRERLTAAASPANSRMASATEIERYLGRGGFTGHLLAYATDARPASLETMGQLLDEAALEAGEFAGYDSELFARLFLEVVRGRIAQGRLAIVSLQSGGRDASVVAIEFAADISAFDTAFATFRAEEQRLQTLSALNVLNLQRWITSLALGAAVFVMGAAAVLLYVNVRRPLRELSESLEDLLVDDEERTLAEVDRTDEIGMLARAAEKLRRTQLQAGRLLTVGPDGALRLRLEGENALAVEDAVRELTTAADTVRTSALALSASGDELVDGSRDALSRVEAALTETVEETSGRLGTLSGAGEEVLRLAGDLEAMRRKLAGTESEWRDEMANLAETMRGELERLRVTAERLTKMTETAGARVESVGGRLVEITDAWEKEQAALNDASTQARENLTARLVTLDAQIGNLDDTLENLEDVTARAASPIETATDALAQAVSSLGLAGDSATAATELMSKEVEAARNARLSVISEAEADRAHWQKDRAAIRQQAEDIIVQMTETANRVEGLVRELTESSQDMPGKLDRLTADLAGLSGEIKSLEQTGGALATQLGGRLAAVHEALSEARAALSDEADTIRDVTSDLKDLHLSFENESRAVGEQVSSVAETLEKLDGHLQAINQRVVIPVDLSPVLAALKNEMGQAVTRLTQTIEGQSIDTQTSLTQTLSQLGDRIEARGDGHEQLIATGLSELSEKLHSKIAAQSEAARGLAAVLNDLNERVNALAETQSETTEMVRSTGERLATTNDIAALINPKLESLHETADALGEELRSMAREIANQEDDATPQMLEQISRVEELQGGLGQAQQAVALALRDGLIGIARRLKGSNVSGLSKQLNHVVATLVRQQDRFAEAILDMSTDMGERIDDLAGEIARGNRQARIPRKVLKNKAGEAKDLASAANRVSRTAAPKENDLSAIYDALRGLTDELKGLSDEEPGDGIAEDDGTPVVRRQAV